jgi:hypothetical protein
VIQQKSGVRSRTNLLSGFETQLCTKEIKLETAVNGTRRTSGTLCAYQLLVTTPPSNYLLVKVKGASKLLRKLTISLTTILVGVGGSNL